MNNEGVDYLNFKTIYNIINIKVFVHKNSNITNTTNRI